MWHTVADVGRRRPQPSSHFALLDPAKVGMGLTVFARVWLNGQNEETVAPFVKAI